MMPLLAAALQPASLQRPAILRYASWAVPATASFSGTPSSRTLANPTNVLRCTVLRLVEQTRIPSVFIIPTNCAGGPA
jgi:hypothetical protein